MMIKIQFKIIFQLLSQEGTYFSRYCRFADLKFIRIVNAQCSCLQFDLINFVHRQIWNFELKENFVHLDEHKKNSLACPTSISMCSADELI